MSKQTLLDMVQDILSDMDSDEVNSIDDTVEAQQVAQILKTAYYEMLGNRNWPHTRKLIQLDAVSDLSRPNYLRLPENLKELDSFKYDKRKLADVDIDLQDVLYKEPDVFLRYVSARSSSAANVKNVIDYSGTSILTFNDVAPSYWTSFDDTYLVTDSYDSGIDSTLQKSKTQCMAYVVPIWDRSDSFTPDLPVDAFSALIAEAKSISFISLKQMANQKAEQQSKRQQTWLSRKAWRAHGGVQYENYGRKSRK